VDSAVSRASSGSSQTRYVTKGELTGLVPVLITSSYSPEPPETLDIFEHERYISKLIHWGLEASQRERSRPHLVEGDSDKEEHP